MMRAATAQRLREARSSLVALFALLTLSSATVSAAPITPTQVVGDWEVTRLLVTDGFSNSQRSMKPDDANVMGRTYSLQMNSVTFKDEEIRCKLDTSLAKRTYGIKTLFADERLPRPKIIRTLFYRRAAQYALGPLAGEQVTIYAYRCDKSDDRETQLNNSGNWFAATKDTIIWPLGPDALVLLKRPPTQPAAEQTAFCNIATSASDKTICADREMWRMLVFTETVRGCAIGFERRKPDELRAQLDAYVTKRTACEGIRSCVYGVLDEHASILAQSIPSVQDCLDLKTKK